MFSLRKKILFGILIFISFSSILQASSNMVPIMSYLLSSSTTSIFTYTQTTMIQGTTYTVAKGDKIKRDTNPTTIIVETNLHTKTTTAKLESGSATLSKIK